MYSGSTSMFTGLKRSISPSNKNCAGFARKPRMLNSSVRVIPLRKISDFGEVDHEEEDVGDIDLPDTLQEPRRADDKPTFEHHPRKDKSDSVAGNEDEE